MTGRERISAAIHYRPVDRAPLQYYYTPVGFYEHGEKLNDLFETLPGDFMPFTRQPIPVISDSERDADGRYHYFFTDEWGTTWEKRIFGVTGIPCGYPLKQLDSMEDLERYPFPPIRPLSRPEIDGARRAMADHQKQYYGLMGAGNLFEKLLALRPDEEVLCDIALDEEPINALADRIVEYDARAVQLAIAAGADGISFGDDYGTERGMLIGPEMWRRFIKPRLARLFAPAKAAGLDIVFHSCGRVMDILPDLKEVGVDAVWPQLPAYNMEELAARCRSLGLAVAIHTDRANTMTFGTPEQVRELVRREYDVFRMWEGGSWFYVEADNDFPFANIEALVETIAEWR